MLKVKGFTLIELMITLAILAIVLGLAAPAMSDFVIRQRVSGQASELMLALAMARSEAVKQGADIAVLPATNAGTGWTDGWCVGRLDNMTNCADPDRLRNFVAAKGVTLSSNYLQTGTGVTLFFKRDGTCPNCSNNFTITSPRLKAAGADARCVDISLLGRATIRKITRDTAC
jgi:type IV fimbrial biogenesis protein FimT